MGRYKLGPQGAYWDPNDSGPDQASPDQIQQLQQQQSSPDSTGGYRPPTGGINPGPYPLPTGPIARQLPNIPGQPGWNGGFTGGGRDPFGMPQVKSDPALEQFYAEQKAQGKSFPEIMDAWRARTRVPQQTNILGGIIGSGGMNLPPAIATDPTTGQMYDPATRSGSGTIGSPNYNDFYNRIYQRFLPQSQGFGAALSPLYQGASLGLAK